MEITKAFVQDWLEKFISENPNADTFDIVFAAMEEGKNPTLSEKELDKWFEEESSVYDQEEIAGISSFEFYQNDFKGTYLDYLDFCLDMWNELSAEEKRDFYNAHKK